MGSLHAWDAAWERKRGWGLKQLRTPPRGRPSCAGCALCHAAPRVPLSARAVHPAGIELSSRFHALSSML